MRLLIIAVCALCAMSLYSAVTAPREPVAEIPTPSTLAAHYGRTGRVLEQMGEGF